MSQCLDLVYAICKNKLSHLPYPNSKRTSMMCYTFQREKDSNPWSRKSLRQKSYPDPDFVYHEFENYRVKLPYNEPGWPFSGLRPFSASKD